MTYWDIEAELLAALAALEYMRQTAALTLEDGRIVLPAPPYDHDMWKFNGRDRIADNLREVSVMLEIKMLEEKLARANKRLDK